MLFRAHSKAKRIQMQDEDEMADQIFGFHAHDVRCFVTNPPREAGSITIVPVSIGFKQRDGSWMNVFFDLKCFNDTKGRANQLQKKDRVEVSGRLEYSEWTDSYGNKRPQWGILVNKLERMDSGGAAPSPQYGQQQVRQAPQQMDDAPF